MKAFAIWLSLPLYVPKGHQSSMKTQFPGLLVPSDLLFYFHLRYTQPDLFPNLCNHPQLFYLQKAVIRVPDFSPQLLLFPPYLFSFSTQTVL